MFGCTVPSGLLHGILRPNFLIDFTKNSFGKSMNIFWLLAVFHGKLSSFAKKKQEQLLMIRVLQVDNFGVFRKKNYQKRP